MGEMADHFLGDVVDPCYDADYAQLEVELVNGDCTIEELEMS